METVLIFATVISPIILALVELIKKTVNVKKNFIPLLALIVGLAIGALSYPFTDLDLTFRLWAGGFAGLAATGLFEIGNKREGNTKEDNND
ncbi:holin [Alkalihalobacillus trypoxylicola]|uniref:Holin n=1 Tax=Alkalihalobacillus trypoxylicola TaxID=519424 RepID=A0A162D5K2_9BACI|nr:holin [Alkalihalobacillus trypoxylicola]KYG28189.1 holin [Alkalihalobacillus trypoxylicola]